MVPRQAGGWIAPGDFVEAAAGTELYGVRQFWEKPDQLTAARLFASGYFWNTFVLAGGVDAFLGLAEVGVPEVLTPLRAVASSLGTPAEVAGLAQAYKHLRATNLSRALLARYPEALTVLAARGITWCDWGDPGRIIRSLRRIDKRPVWLPNYARKLAASAPCPSTTKPRLTPGVLTLGRDGLPRLRKDPRLVLAQRRRALFGRRLRQANTRARWLRQMGLPIPAECSGN
jgi:hypothetical protein